VEAGEAAPRWPEELRGVAERQAHERPRSVSVERGSQHLDPPGLDVHRDYCSRGVNERGSVNSLGTGFELRERSV
jgi:hypothetical protein